MTGRVVSTARGWEARRRRRQVAVLAVGAAILLYLLLSVLRVDPFSDKATVRAVFDDARGLARAGRKTTTEVRLNGAKVGDLDDVERQGDDAVFTMKIEEEAARDLRQDAIAELRPRTPFEGNSYLDLQAGSPDAPPLEGPIPRSQTRSYVSLYEALSFARPEVREDTRAVVRELSRVLAPSGREGIQRMLRELPALTRDLGPGARAFGGPHGNELSGMVRGAAETFSAVAERERSLVPFLRGAERTFGALNTDGGRAFDAALRAFPGTLRSLETGGGALISMLDRLDPLASDLAPGLQELPVALTELEPLLSEGAPALARATPLVRDLRRALHRGGRATPPTRALLEAARPTVDVLNQSLLAALHRDTPVGLPAYLALLNTLEGGAGSFSTFQTEQQGRQPMQMGSGHFVHFEGRFYSGYATPEVPPCDLVERANPELAEMLGAQGVCVP